MEIDCNNCTYFKWIGYAYVDNAQEECLLFEKKLTKKENVRVIPCDKCIRNATI